MNDLLLRLRSFAESDDGAAPYNANGPLVLEAIAEIERLRVTLLDLEAAFSKTNEIPETPFTLHALAAIRRALYGSPNP